MRRGITNKLVSFAVIALVITGIILGIYVASVRSEASARRQSQDVLRDNSYRQVVMLATALDGQVCALKLLSGTLDIHAQDELDDVIKLAENELNCGEIFITDANGVTLNGHVKGLDISNRTYVSEALSGRVGMEAIIPSMSDQQSISLAVPIYEDGKVTGTLCGLYFIRNLSELLFSNADESDGYSYIVNSKGDIIIGTGANGSRITGTNISAIADSMKLDKKSRVLFSNFISDLSIREEDILSFNKGDIVRYVVAVPFDSPLLPENDWFVVNVATEKEMRPQIISARDDAITAMIIFSIFSIIALVLFLLLRRRYEKQIRVDNTTMQSLLSEMPGAYVRLRFLPDGQFTPVYANKNSYLQAGMTKTELIELYKKDMSERVHPDDLDRVRKTFHESIYNGAIKDLRYRLITGSGEYRWFSVNGHISKDGNDSFINLFYIDANNQEEARQRYAITMSKMDAEITNEVGRCYLNITRDFADNNQTIYPEAMEFCLDNGMDSLIVRISDWLPVNEERVKYRTVFSRQALINSFNAGIEHVELEHRIKTDGEMRWIRSTVSMIKNPDTGDLEAALYAQDTNNEHRMRHLLNIVVDSSYDFIIVVNIKTSRYHTFSKSGTITTSFQTEGEYERSIVGLMEYIHPQDRKNTIAAVRLPSIVEKLKLEGQMEINYRIFEDLSIRDKKLSCIWFDDSKQEILLCRSDITELMEKESMQREQLADALKIAEQANAAKTDFLSAMSHDIRTPMNAIVGMTELALEDMSNTAQVTESLDIIKTSSAHLLALINDILDMSRIESGKMVLADEPFSHAELFANASVIYRASAEEKGITFLPSISTVHDRCYGDMQRMSRVVDNLMGNAIKFTAPGGTVRLSFHELQSDMPGIALFELVVSDNGAGMSKETISHIFEPFYRAESSKSANIQGTGLGLSIVKSIIDLIGGTMDVSSELGKGTTFTVRAPLRIAGDTQEPPVKKTTYFTERDLRGINVLLCEDNYVNQLVAVRLLERMGANVTIAEDGQQGYKMFTGKPAGTFDAILMDVQMPVMNGYEATDAIRTSEHKDAKTIPIIAMTANAFVEDVHKSLSAGMNAHLSKPIEPERLYESLAYLRRHS